MLSEAELNTQALMHALRRVLQPTNDLDLGTVESLESFLAEYKGCLLVASHDRAFMAGLDRLFVLKGDGLVRLFEGSYAEVRAPPQARALHAPLA